MKITPSPETIRAVAAALGQASFIDDRIAKPDPGRIQAWSELVEPHKLGYDDLQQGVKDYYSFPRDGRALQVADLITCSRNVRAERNQRENESERVKREDMIDARVAEMTRELAAAATPPVEVKFHRPTNNHLSVRCPWCKASVGRHCTVPQTNERPAGGTHPSRIEAAQVAS